MGCDIHAHTEVKINGKWEHYSDLHIHRSYDLFARMADVRNGGDIEPIAEPRGLPEDISLVTKIDRDHWGVDGHSDSWLSGAEIESLGEWIKTRPYKTENTGSWWVYDTFGFCFGNGWNIAKYPTDYPDSVTDARVVFWFDN